ncbi:cytochrome c oxidase subunit II [Sphingobacterium oryzagri]|uniref:Cytochrome c oxidase subunit 2 n=1 Tax=Sphingobacterium oryzagri TaxID=3025669 RepID=A0ABY7WEW5_9SPHI|nr:cytochrome c oxidase subunit II [Sphingobacterium sp. KACC 22765]WDF68176.1 cytochrome c oxidase subunit II [Sphingobacterium sp. KACC 22765]
MKLKINNRFKAVLGCLLAVGLLFSTPSFALQQDSLAQDTSVSAVADTSAASDTAAADSAATDSVSADDASAGSTTASSTSTPEPEKQIDPQVYKNITYYILLFLIVCTIVAVIGKVLSIYELTRKMNGKYNPFANNTFQSVLFIVFLVAFFALVYYGYAVWGAWAWRDAVTEHGAKIDSMFIVTTVIITVVLVLVHLLLLTFPYIYRMRAKTKAYYYPHNDTIEKIWTIVPAIVLTVLVLFGFFTWRSITNVPEDLQKSALQVEVLGEQFQWQVRYPGNDGVIGKRNYKMTTPTNSYGIDFNDKNAWDDIQASDIVLPVNKSVRFHIISKDIIHSFYIPDFRVQINAVPGMTNYFQFTPTVTTEEMRERMNDPKYDYVMLCNKICGSGHFNMQKKVVVVTEEEYKEWLSTQNKYFTEDLQKEFTAVDSQDSKELATASLN